MDVAHMAGRLNRNGKSWTTVDVDEARKILAEFVRHEAKICDDDPPSDDEIEALMLLLNPEVFVWLRVCAHIDGVHKGYLQAKEQAARLADANARTQVVEALVKAAQTPHVYRHPEHLSRLRRILLEEVTTVLTPPAAPAVPTGAEG